MNEFFYYNHPKSDIIVFDSFFISQIHEGATVDKNGAESVQFIIDKHFSDKPWIYISNRITSYAVHPFVYNHAAGHKHLKGIAIVVSDIKKQEAAKFEKNFALTPLTIVDSITKAIHWGESTLSLE